MHLSHSLSSAVVALVLAVGLIGMAEAAADPTNGEHVFAKCAACHSTDGSVRVGPSLRGVIGRKAGTIQGYHYSRAMKSSTVVWDETALDTFLTAPQKAVPGTTMPFSGLPKPQERADLIEFLKTLK